MALTARCFFEARLTGLIESERWATSMSFQEDRSPRVALAYSICKPIPVAIRFAS